MNTKKEKYLKKIEPKQGRKKCIILGILTNVFFITNPFFVISIILGNILNIQSDGATVFMIFAPFIINPIFWILYVGNILEKSNARKRNYITILDNKRIDSLDTLAGANGISYEKTKEEISKLLQEGLVADMYIDDMNRKIIYTDNNTPTYEQQEKTVTCPACGATNTIIPSRNNVCEYCGAVLNL